MFHCFVMVFLLTVLVSDEPVQDITMCSDDTQCSSNQFCGEGNLGYSICQHCLSCSVANRQVQDISIKCPISYYQCGPCIDGFQLKKNTGRCKSIPGFLASGTTTASPESDPDEKAEHPVKWYEWLIITLIVCALSLVCLVLYKYRLYWKNFYKRVEADDIRDKIEPSVPDLSQPASN